MYTTLKSEKKQRKKNQKFNKTNYVKVSKIQTKTLFSTTTIIIDPHSAFLISPPQFKTITACSFSTTLILSLSYMQEPLFLITISNQDPDHID